MEGKVLVIQLRNFGDAIQTIQIVNSLKKNFPKITLDLLIRKDFASMYYNNPYVNKIYFANYPVGTRKNFRIKDLVHLVKLVNELKKKYDVVINNIGDFREDFLGFLLKPKKNISPKFKKTHPLSYYIRQAPFDIANFKIEIPDNVINIYDIQEYILKTLGCYHVYPPQIFLNKKVKKENIIGIHPLSSLKNKMWSIDKWIHLINEILENFTKYKIYLFGAPSEKKQLEEIKRKCFKNKDKLYIITENLEKFFFHLSKVRALIGVDSFSSHAAYALGIPNIVIFTSSDYRVFKTPISYVVSSNENICSFYPCHNKPHCVSKDFEYSCIKSIEPEQVFEKLYLLLNERDS